MAVSKLLSNTFFFNLKGPSPDRKRLSGRYDPSSKVYVILQKKICQSWEWELQWKWMAHSAEDAEGTPSSLERGQRRGRVWTREEGGMVNPITAEMAQDTIKVCNILLQDVTFVHHSQPLGRLTTFTEILCRSGKDLCSNHTKKAAPCLHQR